MNNTLIGVFFPVAILLNPLFPTSQNGMGNRIQRFPKGTDVTKHQEQTQAWKRLEVEIRHSRKMWAYVNNDFRNPARKPFEVGRFGSFSFTMGFSTIPGGCLGFLNHQQYNSTIYVLPVEINNFSIWKSYTLPETNVAPENVVSGRITGKCPLVTVYIPSSPAHVLSGRR